MKIEIFVVRTKIEAIQEPDFERQCYVQLRCAKEDLIAEFGGLTIIPNLKGYWLNEQKDKVSEICRDNVEIWQILARKLTIGQAKYLFYRIEQIKQATQQSVQLFSLNDFPIEI